jgi:hypothetical protein
MIDMRVGQDACIDLGWGESQVEIALPRLRASALKQAALE